MIYRQALKYPLIAQIFQSQSAAFPGKDGSAKTLDAQNELLTRYPGDFAGKTGFTDLARKLPVELREGDDGIQPMDLDQLRKLLDGVEQLVIPSKDGEAPA